VTSKKRGGSSTRKKKKSLHDVSPPCGGAVILATEIEGGVVGGCHWGESGKKRLSSKREGGEREGFVHPVIVKIRFGERKKIAGAGNPPNQGITLKERWGSLLGFFSQVGLPKSAPRNRGKR